MRRGQGAIGHGAIGHRAVQSAALLGAGEDDFLVTVAVGEDQTVLVFLHLEALVGGLQTRVATEGTWYTAFLPKICFFLRILEHS